MNTMQITAEDAKAAFAHKAHAPKAVALRLKFHSSVEGGMSQRPLARTETLAVLFDAGPSENEVATGLGEALRTLGGVAGLVLWARVGR